VLLTTPGLAPTFSNIAATAIAHKLPLISFLKNHTLSGALMSYGPVVERYFPRAAILADRILKGAKPGDLPIERPAKFELVTNLRTAKALGLAVSPALLARADEAIE
jgi:putative ABC transport system substrate-binding protein